MGESSSKSESPRSIWPFVIALVAVVAGVWAIFHFMRPPDEPAAELNPADPEAQVALVEKLLQARLKEDETLWAKETLAQKHEAVIVNLWDQLRVSADAWAVLGKFPFETMLIPQGGSPQMLEHGISLTPYTFETDKTLTHAEFAQIIDGLQAQGFKLAQSEWYHTEFHPPEVDQTTRPKSWSVFRFVLHVANETSQDRYIVDGLLKVIWADPPSQDAPPAVQSLVPQTAKLLHYAGPPTFEEKFTVSMQEPGKEKKHLVHTLVYDLDGDGLSEIILPDINEVHWNKGGWNFEPAPLFEKWLPGLNYERVTVALAGDFNADRRVDIFVAGARRAAVYLQSEQGKYDAEPVEIQVKMDLSQPLAATAGDIDGDGDLDIWLTQYLQPYLSGQMPQPFYDARDGYPSYLLVNDGQAQFSDATESSGLAKKRNRRTLSCSFYDMDDDLDLDLLTINDFSGADLYRNDGHGHFEDVTNDLLSDRYAFGMSHAFADYNLDGRLDIYFTGMDSTTVHRLDQLGLYRPGHPDHKEKRGLMTYGNRMLLGQPQGGYKQSPLNDQVARTGWSWGTVAFDFDNDADRDLLVANGNLSNGTAKDYCTRYWCHDIYLGNSQPNAALDDYFLIVQGREMVNMSWNGFEHNALLLNEAGGQFTNVAWLMDAASEYDARNVVADDLDADGRVDLLIVEARLDKSPLVHVVQNNWPQAGHWIGIQLPEGGPGKSPLGAKLAVEAGGKRYPAVVVSGDSYKSQHAATVHFGLGTQDTVDRAIITWPNGQTQTLESPAVDQYHRLSIP